MSRLKHVNPDTAEGEAKKPAGASAQSNGEILCLADTHS